MSGQQPYLSAAAPYNYPRDLRYSSNPSFETAMVSNRRPSMLASYHNQYNSSERASMPPYYLPIPNVSMGPNVNEHSKHSRYPPVNSQYLPIGIDVKKEQALYQPTTEAISPIHDESKLDSHLRDATIIRNTICKLDSDIEMTVKRLHRAQLSQNEIKRQAVRTAVEDEETDETIQINGSQTLIEQILHDNRKLAEEDEKVHHRLTNHMDLSIPLYQEPSDLQSIGIIRRQYMNVMKNRLVNLFKKSRERYLLRTKFSSEHYDQNYQQWQKSIEKEEKLILAKDISTYRETFEKTFAELRKVREDKEKKQTSLNSTEASSSSIDPLVSQQNPPTTSVVIASNDQEIEADEEKMRKSSIIPPILYDCWQRKHHFYNRNGLIKEDAAVFYKEFTKLPYWSPEERQIFLEKFTQSPKNFGYISSFLDNKSTEQCVQFYYMTKKTENYKNLLRKQTQNTRRRTKQNQTTTMTTTTVTSSTTIETTLVTKVTSSNTIVSQQILGSTNGTGQDLEPSGDRLDNYVDRDDPNDEKRSNKNRCQFLSCTTARKKTRKNRLRAFPSKWNELTDEQREEIRRSLQIPLHVQRCCTRCYEKLFHQIPQRQNNQNIDEEEDDDEDDEEMTMSNLSTSKLENDEWTTAEIDAFNQAMEKYNHNWRQIAESLQRSEQSCREFYKKQQENALADDNVEEENGSISDAELNPNKSNEEAKLNLDEDSVDSTHPMIIDDREEIRSINDETTTTSIEKINLSTSNLTTINSLVEKEICRTLNETDKRLSATTFTHSDSNSTLERSTHSQIPNQPAIAASLPAPAAAAAAAPPPPLVIPVRPHSPVNSHYPYSSHPVANAGPISGKGSIMRGTPIATSVPSHKSMPIDQTPTHPHSYSNHRPEPPSMKSPKVLDRGLEQQHLIQQQQQHAAYMRHFAQQQSPAAVYLSQQQQQQQQKSSNAKLESSNPNRFETLKEDYLTSKYLRPSAAAAATHSPNHERSHRTGGAEHRSSRQSSPPINQALLPPPTAVPSTSNPSVQTSGHPHHSQPTVASGFLPPSQLFAQSSMYPPELLNSNALPYASYYASLPPGTPLLIDPRVMQEYAAAAAAANNEQFKVEQQKLAMRSARHHPHHSPSEPSSYQSHPSSRHGHEEIGYHNADYLQSVWRTPNMNNNALIKGNHGPSENAMMKINDLPRYSTSRLPPNNDRDLRSPDDPHHAHHRVSQSRGAVESPSVHFQRVEAQNSHKFSHDKGNPHLHYLDSSNDPNALAYLRQPMHMGKGQGNHPSPHRPHPNPNNNNRSMIPPTTIPNSSMQSNYPPSAYMMHGFHQSPVATVSPHRQHQQVSPHPSQSHYSQSSRASHSYESDRFKKDPMSIQEFINKRVTDFVRSTNNDHKHPGTEFLPHEHSTHPSVGRISQANNSEQLILIDGDDDLNAIEQCESDGNMRNMAQKSHPDLDMAGRRRGNSIKKILSNQSLEKQQYDDINQQVQNSSSSSSNSNGLKLPVNADQAGLERSNSIGGRTRSRGSITMRMLMGENEAYLDGKALPKTSPDDSSKKRSLSSENNCEKIEYLIRDELVRSRPSLVKGNESPPVFFKPPLNQSPKRMRTSTKDDDQRPSPNPPSHELSSGAPRDPFALQPQSKSSHPPFPISSNTDRSWQSYAQQQQQQQYHHSSLSINPRSSRPSGSITQGSPISPSMRLSTDQIPYASATNNQLINPRYPYYINRNEQQYPLSRQSSTSPHEDSPKHKIARRSYQDASPSSDSQTPSSFSAHADPVPTNTPPSNPSPTSISAHSLKKRLINEYELEKQRNSPVSATSPVKPETPEETAMPPSSSPPPPPPINEPTGRSDAELVSKTETTNETVSESNDDSVHTT